VLIQPLELWRSQKRGGYTGKKGGSQVGEEELLMQRAVWWTRDALCDKLLGIELAFAAELTESIAFTLAKYHCRILYVVVQLIRSIS
jgi:hypothetical protein